MAQRHSLQRRHARGQPRPGWNSGTVALGQRVHAIRCGEILEQCIDGVLGDSLYIISEPKQRSSHQIRLTGSWIHAETVDNRERAFRTETSSQVVLQRDGTRQEVKECVHHAIAARGRTAQRNPASPASSTQQRPPTVRVRALPRR